MREEEKKNSQRGHEDIKGSSVKVMLDPFFLSDLRCLNVPSVMNNSQDENHLRPLSAMFSEFHIQKYKTSTTFY